MAITVKHKFVSTIPDGDDASVVRPSNWNDTHELTGLGTMAEQDANAVAITGGTISGVAVTGYVPTTTTITAGTGLTGGGDLSANRTIALANTAVTTGTYGNASRTITQTVDQQGRLTNIFDQPIEIAYTAVTGLGTAATENVGVANGVASLDSGGKVPISELPAAVLGALSYQGTWNASTNTPTLASGVGTKGYYYVVDVAGSTNLDGITDWVVGDWAVFNGTVWQQIDNTDAVTSVNGYTGTVVLGYADVGAPSTTGTNATGTWGISVTGNAATATTSTNLAGGSSGQIAYQSAPNTTTFVTAGASGQVLSANAGGIPTWITNTVGTVTSVDLSAGTGISVSGGPITSSGSITVVNTAPDQIVAITGAGTTTVTGTYPNFTITSNDEFDGDVVGPASATDNAIARFDTTTGKLIQNSVVTIDDAGNEAGINSISFDTTPTTVPTTPGSLYWDSANGNQTLSLVMANGDAIQQIGEETYFRIRASAAITEGQVVMFTGTIGGSGALTGAPASGLTATTASYVMGIATHNLAINDWGYITSFGLVRGIDTTGGAEAWVDGQILYYDPTVAGGLTKTVPVAPNAKIQVCAVVNAASGGSGSVFVRPTFGGALGQYEGDVQVTTPANGDLLIRNQTTGEWVNAPLTAGTAISVSNTAGAVTVTNTAPDQVVSITGAGTTSVTGTYPNFTVTSNDQYVGTVTSVAALTIGTAGTDLSSTVANGTTTPVISLQVPTASATNRGALSAADWSTFNSKAPAVTYTTSYVPYGQGTTTPNQSSSFTFDGTTQTAPIQRASNGIMVNSKTISASYSIASGDCGMSVGPVTVASGQTVTVASGSRWVVL